MRPHNHTGRTDTSKRRRPSLYLAAAFAVLSAGLATMTACDFDEGIPYRCSNTNNCADLPTTVCGEESGFCICTKAGHIFCDRYNMCVLETVCYPDAGPPPCDAGTSGAGGSGSGGNGGGGGAGGG
jgi:hypothetical protein